MGKEAIQARNLLKGWDDTISFSLDAARGMEYLHSRTPPILHRDMKSPNLLIDSNWRIKISDFGFSTIKKAASNLTRVGSPVWAAPEVMRGEPYTEKLDIYSFAIVMWELLTRDE